MSTPSTPATPRSPTSEPTAPVGVALIGAGWIGAFHGQSLAQRIPDARLVGGADPAPGAAERLTARLGTGRATSDLTSAGRSSARPGW